MTGKQLKSLREKQKIEGKPISQAALGRMLGYSRSAICMMESGATPITKRMEILLHGVFNGKTTGGKRK
jgi:transcriptional regulator with XRE-family HTH domain